MIINPTPALTQANIVELRAFNDFGADIASVQIPFIVFIFKLSFTGL